MNRFVSNFILGFFVLVLMVVYGFAKQPTVYSMLTQKNQPTTEVEAKQDVSTRRVILPNGTTIAAKVADTPESQQTGLAGVENLDNNAGMLFVFNQTGTYPMWMKGMKMPIDMLWLDDGGKVVHLATKVQPTTNESEMPTYSNDQPARYVLELAAGTAESANLKEGDTLAL